MWEALHFFTSRFQRLKSMTDCLQTVHNSETVSKNVSLCSAFVHSAVTSKEAFTEFVPWKQCYNKVLRTTYFFVALFVGWLEIFHDGSKNNEFKAKYNLSRVFEHLISNAHSWNNCQMYMNHYFLKHFKHCGKRWRIMFDCANIAMY